MLLECREYGLKLHGAKTIFRYVLITKYPPLNLVVSKKPDAFPCRLSSNEFLNGQLESLVKQQNSRFDAERHKR